MQCARRVCVFGQIVRHYYDTIFVIKKKRMEQNRAREQGGSKLRVFTRPYRNGSHCCGGESSQSEIWYARGLLARVLFAIGLFTTGLYASRLFTTGLYASRPTFWGCTPLDKIWYVRGGMPVQQSECHTLFHEQGYRGRHHIAWRKLAQWSAGTRARHGKKRLESDAGSRVRA